MTEQPEHVLIVDDEEEIRRILARILEKEGFRVVAVADGLQAIRRICLEAPAVILMDMCMPGLNGMEVLKRIKKLDGDLPVVLITAFANIHQAVEAMKEGANNYLAKPFDNNEVVGIVRKALAESQLRKNLKKVTDQYEGNLSLIERMGPSNKITRLVEEIHRVAGSDFSVIITGETGSGKELVARAIHGDSLRAAAPFMAVDCGAIPENLLESELFGHEKGSFTGADRQKIGKFELAHSGTIFMDEIANMPAGSQAKFLRVIQDRKLYRVGGVAPVNVDIRLIAATNQDLQQMVSNGTFRDDLYYRLSEFSIYVPALRERADDIPFLAKRFLDLANIELKKTITGFVDEALEMLMSYDWPGNVRQLRSIIRRAALVAGETITAGDIGIKQTCLPRSVISPKVQGAPWKTASLREIVQQSTLAVEREVLFEVLRFTGGNKARAARLLQVDYKTIHSKARKFGIQLSGGSNDGQK